MRWLYLTAAVLTGTTATILLKVAARGRPGAYVAVVLGHLAAFSFLSLALRAGMGLGVAYGLWAASGVALTAAISHVVFGEPFTRLMLLGVGLVAAGVLILEMSAPVG